MQIRNTSSSTNSKQIINIIYGYTIEIDNKRYILYIELSSNVFDIRNPNLFWKYKTDEYIYSSIIELPNGLDELKKILYKKIIISLN